MKLVNIENIKFFNPWHVKGDFLYKKEVKLHKRWKFKQIKQYLDGNLMISIVGLRRTGKTTIIRQLINLLLQKGINPKKIFFYEFEEEIVDLEKTLKYYFNNILREDLYETECYIFLDELQMIEGWQNVLKKYYDVNSNIKFIVSGSTHIYLHKNIKESLAGRIIDIQLMPLGWYEFLDFKYQKKYSIIKNIFADNFLEQAKKQSDIVLFKEDFLTFIAYAEFPHFFKKQNLKKLEEYYRNSILDKIFLKDIQFFDIENQRFFKEFFKVLNKDTAQEINFSNLSREIELPKKIIKEYIEILAEMYLHKILYKEEKSIRKQIKSFKKGYVQSLNLLNVTLKTNFWDMNKKDFGHIIETFVFNEFQKNDLEEITFYHNTKRKKEVDFILKNGKTILPVEVKITSQIKPKHLKNLLYFAKKNNLQRAIIIYGGNEIKQKIVEDVSIEFLPYWVV